jgi:hypothetical protein
MPLTLPAGLKDLIDSGDVMAQGAIDIVLTNGTALPLATAQIQIDSKLYKPSLRSTGQLRKSLRKTVDKLDITAQNVDMLLGRTVFGAQKLFNGARATFSGIYIEDDGTVYQVDRLAGEIDNARVSELTVSFKLTSDFSSQMAIVGWRTLGKLCQFRLGSRQCGSTSTHPCNKHFTGDNGCEGHDAAPRIVQIVTTGNQASYGGFLFREQTGVPTSTGRPPGGIVFNGGHPQPGSGLGNEGDDRFNRGRWRVPFSGVQPYEYASNF